MTGRRHSPRALAAIVPLFVVALGTAPLVSQRASARSIVAMAGAKGECDVDRTTVGVGDVVEYSITVTTDGSHSPARSPSPGNVDGFDPLGSFSSTRQSINAANGSVVVTTTITVTYRLLAKSLGAHVLGPGRMFVDGSQVGTGTVVVTVVPKGKAPPAPKKGSGSPFPDPFFNDPFFGNPAPDDLFPQPEPENEPPSDPMARVDALPTDPKERNVFVRIVPDIGNPIVGEQVTVKMFVYARRRPRISVKRPPGFADFVTVDLGQLDHDWHSLTIEGENWSYANIGAYAIFPLKTGSLDASPAEIEWQDVFSSGGAHDASSNEMRLESIEPPVDGRPKGYVLGDVASDLELSAEVAPRDVVDGHALLTLRMKGAGRLDPLRPILPTPENVKWTPTGDESRQTIDFATIRGVRKTTFDVAFDREQPFDLGDVHVDVWDAKKKKYVVVRAPLGRVRVVHSASAASSTSASPLSELPAPRDDVGESGMGSSLVDRGWTWGVVGGAPIAVVVVQGIGAVIARAKKRAGQKDDDPATRARDALDDARTALKKGEREHAAGAMTRALDRALEAATAIRARSLTKSELRDAIERAKLPESTASRVLSLLASLEDARFAGKDPPAITDVEMTVERLVDIPRRKETV